MEKQIKNALCKGDLKTTFSDKEIQLKLKNKCKLSVISTWKKLKKEFNQLFLMFVLINK